MFYYLLSINIPLSKPYPFCVGRPSGFLTHNPFKHFVLHFIFDIGLHKGHKWSMSIHSCGLQSGKHLYSEEVPMAVCKALKWVKCRKEAHLKLYVHYCNGLFLSLGAYNTQMTAWAILGFHKSIWLMLFDVTLFNCNGYSMPGSNINKIQRGRAVFCTLFSFVLGCCRISKGRVQIFKKTQE